MMEGYGSDSDEEYIFNLQPGETKEIGLQPDKQPRSYYVNTIVSNNIPPTFQRWTQHYELKENAVEFEGERVIEDKVEFVYANEIVVDNGDNGFKLTEPGSNKLLKKLFESDKDDEFEYVNFNWEPQPKWQLFANTEFIQLIIPNRGKAILKLHGLPSCRKAENMMFIHMLLVHS
jgi:hypothetical protein